MIIGGVISALSLYDIFHNRFTISVLGCFMLGLYLMTHEHNQ